MFDFVQEKKRLVQIVLALIILPFAFWGVESYRKAGGPAPLATVNGEKIGQQEFEYALNQQRQRLGEMGAKLDPAFLDKPEVKQSVLEGLVTQHVLAGEAHSAKLAVPDEQLAEIISSIGAFQKDGKFDMQRYEAALRDRGMNRLQFEARLRQDLLIRELTDAYSQNGYAADVVAENVARLYEQQRVVAEANLDAAEFIGQVKLPENAVNDYYAKHSAEFAVPARAEVQYIVFSADSLLPSVTVTDDEIKNYYAEHQAEFGTQEQRRAAHILIAAGKGASEADRQAARAKAERVLREVRQNPAKFAELAKEYSEDTGSAANGGDLGMFGRGTMDKQFEESVFNLKVGEISDLVQTDFGFHIIKLIATKPGKLQPLSEVKGMIAQRLKSQRANDKFAELAEEFSNAVYEQSDSLKPAAELVKVPVQGGLWLSKGQAPSGLWTEKALQAVFSEESLRNKRNTAALEVAPNTLLAARVTEYKPASVLPLVEVSAEILRKLEKIQSAELAVQKGQELLRRLQAGESVKVSWKPAKSIGRQGGGLDPALVQAVFRADTRKLPCYVGVTGPNGYALARVEAVKEASIDEAKRSRYAQQIRQVTGEELLMAYVADARKRADVTMKGFVSE